MSEFVTIYNEAKKAGLEAGNTVVPTPMQVVQHANPLDDNSPIVKAYEPVMDGCCGFAWINVKPGNSRFARWLKDMGLAKTDSYAGGVTIWIHEYNQNLTRKEKHAQAMAKVLREHFPELKIFSHSRMD